MGHPRDEEDREKEGKSRCSYEDDEGGGGGPQQGQQGAAGDDQHHRRRQQQQEQQHESFPNAKERVREAVSAGRPGPFSTDLASTSRMLERDAASCSEGVGLEKGKKAQHDADESADAKDGEEDAPRLFFTASGGGGGSCSRAVPHRHAGGATDNAIRHFHDAMALVDPAERDGWDKAQKNCPATVLTHECCPCYFLVACNGDPWNAVVRLCSYWMERIGLFEDRAFQPLTMGSDVVEPTGFTKEDVEVLMTGAAALLPTDGSGKTIIFREETRLEPYMHDLWKSRVRVVWYLMQAGYTSGEHQAHQLCTMYGCDRIPPNGQFSSATRQFAFRCCQLRKVMPIHNSTIYLLTRPSTRGTASIVQFMLAFVSMLLGKLFSCVTVMHGSVARPTGNADEDDAEAKESLQRQLRSAGFTKNQIPDWAGGQFTLDEFRAWIRRRRRVEQRLFWTEEQRVMQLRGRGRIKSQRKRQRRRQELVCLENQVQGLISENARAKHEERKLTQMLSEAQAKVKAVRKAEPNSLTGRQPIGSAIAIDSSMMDANPAQALIQGDSSLPPDILALLEPDPIAPSCIPGRLPTRAGQAIPTWESSHGVTYPGLGGTTAQMRSSLLDSWNHHMDESPVPSCVVYGGDEREKLYSISVRAAQLSHATFLSCASDVHDSASMGSTVISVDRNSRPLQSLLDVVGTSPNHSGPYEQSELSSNRSEASHNLVPTVQDYSLISERGMRSLPTATCLHHPRTSSASLSSTLPGTNRLHCRQPADCVGSSQDQPLLWSFSLSVLEAASMPDSHNGEGLQLQRERHGMTSTVDLKPPPSDHPFHDHF